MKNKLFFAMLPLVAASLIIGSCKDDEELVFDPKQVIEHYDSGVKANSPNLAPEIQVFTLGLYLTAQQKQDLKAFLETLNDDTFLNNSDYSDPN